MNFQGLSIQCAILLNRRKVWAILAIRPNCRTVQTVTYFSDWLLGDGLASHKKMTHLHWPLSMWSKDPYNMFLYLTNKGSSMLMKINRNWFDKINLEKLIWENVNIVNYDLTNMFDKSWHEYNWFDKPIW